jgi:hypothetical protein
MTDLNSVRRPTPLFPENKAQDDENIKPYSRFKEADLPPKIDSVV